MIVTGSASVFFAFGGKGQPSAIRPLFFGEVQTTDQVFQTRHVMKDKRPTCLVGSLLGTVLQ